MNLAATPDPLENLPISVEELDAFVAKIVAKYNLPSTDDTYESIATLIMHMPQSSASAPLSYFADSVNKSRANAAAYAKLREFAQKRAAAAEVAKQVETTSKVGSTDGNEPVQNS